MDEPVERTSPIQSTIQYPVSRVKQQVYMMMGLQADEAAKLQMDKSMGLRPGSNAAYNQQQGIGGMKQVVSSRIQ